MKITANVQTGFHDTCDCLVVGIDSQGRMGAVAQLVDQQFSGWLSRAYARGSVTGKFCERLWLPSPATEGPQSFLLVGVGDTAAMDAGKAYKLGGAVLRQLCEHQRGRITLACVDLCPPELHRHLAAGAVTATEGQELFVGKKKIHPPGELVFAGSSIDLVSGGVIIGESINLTRRMVNEPANVMFPAAFAERAIRLGDELGFEVEVWDEDRLAHEGCEALLAVGRGSARESRLVKLRYRGRNNDDAPLALVGKGVTFDSGGLSLKPAASMEDMKCDMAGAATVLGAIAAAARMGIKENVFGYCGLVENMVSADSFRVGDVLRTRSGKTIEILNTDAEGRVVLADVLNVALDDAPSAIIDLATLTGACMVALGTEVSGLFTNHPELIGGVRRAAGEVGEPVWELPMFDFYGDQIRSKVADIKNMGEGRWGGAITAAKFLEEFVAGTPWVHIDIAGPAFAASADNHRDAGATGAMVRTLIQLLETRAQNAT
jgi:leucyl aminopeptidase